MANTTGSDIYIEGGSGNSGGGATTNNKAYNTVQNKYNYQKNDLATLCASSFNIPWALVSSRKFSLKDYGFNGDNSTYFVKYSNKYAWGGTQKNLLSGYSYNSESLVSATKNSCPYFVENESKIYYEGTAPKYDWWLPPFAAPRILNSLHHTIWYENNSIMLYWYDSYTDVADKSKAAGYCNLSETVQGDGVYLLLQASGGRKPKETTTYVTTSYTGGGGGCILVYLNCKNLKYGSEFFWVEQYTNEWGDTDNRRTGPIKVWLYNTITKSKTALAIAYKGGWNIDDNWENGSVVYPDELNNKTTYEGGYYDFYGSYTNYIDLIAAWKGGYGWKKSSAGDVTQATDAKFITDSNKVFDIDFANDYTYKRSQIIIKKGETHTCVTATHGYSGAGLLNITLEDDLYYGIVCGYGFGNKDWANTGELDKREGESVGYIVLAKIPN